MRLVVGYTHETSSGVYYMRLLVRYTHETSSGVYYMRLVVGYYPIKLVVGYTI